MVKFFKIRNKRLRWVAGGIILLFLLSCLVMAVGYFFFGVGHGLKALNSAWFSGLVYYSGDPTAGDFRRAGFMVCAFAFFWVLAASVFVWGAKKIGNQLFNSISNSKKEGDS